MDALRTARDPNSSPHSQGVTQRQGGWDPNSSPAPRRSLPAAQTYARATVDQFQNSSTANTNHCRLSVTRITAACRCSVTSAAAGSAFAPDGTQNLPPPRAAPRQRGPRGRGG